MNLKQNIRRFFSLRRRANGGFTLIELIVVIAVLAILAGVAVPAYSGYVAKANMAGDQQLIAAVNKAFISACMEKTVDISTVTSANAKLVIDDATGALDMEDTIMVNDEVKASFVRFFGADSNTKFKVVTSDEILFDRNTHMFKIAEGVKTYTFAGQIISLSAKDVAILSSKNAFSDRGSEALLNDVGTLENYLTGLDGNGAAVLDEVGKSDDFFFAVGSYLGLQQEDYADTAAYKEAVGTELESLDNEQVINNALIMYSASNAANITNEQLNKLFTGTVTSNITVKNQDGSTDNAATMANAALAYGMYTAYKQQHPEAEDVDNFTLTVNSDAFAEYYKSSQGQADLEAYQAAMNMVSDNTSNSEVTSSILNNGIVGNPDLENLMKEVIGK